MASCCWDKQKYHQDLFTLVRTRSRGMATKSGHCIALFSEAKDNVVCGLWEVLTVLGSKALLGSMLGNQTVLGQRDLF